MEALAKNLKYLSKRPQVRPTFEDNFSDSEHTPSTSPPEPADKFADRVDNRGLRRARLQDSALGCFVFYPSTKGALEHSAAALKAINAAMRSREEVRHEEHHT